ncbi:MULTISPECIES: sulfite exporter TauE/SafE family protein [Clostridium]|mgnify:CR=1 FL=1|uniref:Probable membrane transporter protein n=1 Tax=Clostridium cadaveris TaxID=1529 RepID=A0A1I2LGA2_9CLOT|nr:sulfite exporter TauE/SafE family protein [Clostridium cadaveris]MDM8312213.1 sulfite exporter TauE/SafE family protein [Clostridium cadaveris]MDU4951350.1 sulfite exporter TauE/SafE family protein [Clostridium sp.]SFF77479.1 Sulfite exporter TauE/SafE [Clostridium cadaveris]
MLTKIVLMILGILVAIFAVFFIKDFIKSSREGTLGEGSFVTAGVSGFVVNFFDTLGIGAFAPLTALLKGFKITRDKLIPGTLNVACTIPVAVEAFIFIDSIEVEPITLISMIAAASLGAILGAGFVSKLDEKKIQITMAVALLIVAVIMLISQLGLMPLGGNEVGLSGAKLVIAIVGNFILGTLMTVGIGLYAPCMALVYALGLSPKIAFPIMMGSCAFLMPSASIKFVKEKSYDTKASMAVTIFGVIGVFIAAYLVKELPLEVLKWLVILVVLYTSLSMFKSLKSKRAGKA